MECGLGLVKKEPVGVREEMTIQLFWSNSEAMSKSCGEYLGGGGLHCSLQPRRYRFGGLFISGIMVATIVCKVVCTGMLGISCLHGEA